ncbi:nitrogenase component 1, partial [Azospirillum sp. B506]|uniref:nitrogenase component 1 n=1 Tax=Azospirillum sp. B506 TaxID=137721 RepID=UPI0005B2DB12
KTDVPSHFFSRLTGLEASDKLIRLLMELSGRPAPARLRRQREALVDAMLDGHFFYSRKRIAIALEPDLLYAVTGFLGDMGAEVVAAVSPTQSPVLERLKAATIMVGDHSDVETLARDADLIVSNSHGRPAGWRCIWKARTSRSSRSATIPTSRPSPTLMTRVPTATCFSSAQASGTDGVSRAAGRLHAFPAPTDTAFRPKPTRLPCARSFWRLPYDRRRN